MQEKKKAALVEDARQKNLLATGEDARAVALTQTAFSPYWYLLIGPVLIAPLARIRAIVATDSNLYVLKVNFWKGKQVDGVEFTEPLAEARAKTTPFGIRIDGTDKLYGFLGNGGPMKEIAGMTGGAG